MTEACQKTADQPACKQFDWCAISYGSKNGHWKNVIERDQTTWLKQFTILGSVVNLIVGREETTYMVI
jgi:hypothetical protein